MSFQRIVLTIRPLLVVVFFPVAIAASWHGHALLLVVLLLFPKFEQKNRHESISFADIKNRK